MERTFDVVNDIYDHYAETEEDIVDGAFALAGFNPAMGAGQNLGVIFAALKPWDE